MVSLPISGEGRNLTGAQFTVVGIVSDQQQSGTVLWMPLTTLQSVLHTPGAVNMYWITEIEYVGAANDRATYRGVTTAITVLGLLIVAISMVALINTLTMVVLERTREIGILRCIGAPARDVRRIFATEGLTVALAGWLIGIPLSLGLAHAVVTLSTERVQRTRSVHLPGAEHPDCARRYRRARARGHADPPPPRGGVQARGSSALHVSNVRVACHGASGCW